MLGASAFQHNLSQWQVTHLPFPLPFQTAFGYQQKVFYGNPNGNFTADLKNARHGFAYLNPAHHRQQDIGPDFDPHASQSSSPTPQRTRRYLQHTLLHLPELFNPVMPVVCPHRLASPQRQTHHDQRLHALLPAFRAVEHQHHPAKGGTLRHNPINCLLAAPSWPQHRIKPTLPDRGPGPLPTNAENVVPFSPEDPGNPPGVTPVGPLPLQLGSIPGDLELPKVDPRFPEPPLRFIQHLRENLRLRSEVLTLLGDNPHVQGQHPLSNHPNQGSETSETKLCSRAIAAIHRSFSGIGRP